ncbi:DNA repair protein RadA [compost metagenome]
MRAVSSLEARLKEAAKLGFEMAIVPNHNLGGLELPKGLKVIGVTRLMDAIVKATGAPEGTKAAAAAAE